MAAPAQSFPDVDIYTDGGCDPNPGPGGWGAILLYGPNTKEISGAGPATTNNRMELTAAIEALKFLKRPCRVNLYTDSQYLRRGITEWVAGWRAQGWRKANGKPVENTDLWQELVQQVERHYLEWHWVKGHKGQPLNERADRLATEARQTMLARVRSQAPQETPDAGGTGAVQQMLKVDIFAAGSSLGQPGPGGYAAVLVFAPERTQVVSGNWPLATSNAMELWAVVAGLRVLRQPFQVTVYTGSRYVLEGAGKWLTSWERRHWQTRDGQPIKNQELWMELSHLMGDHDMTWQFLTRQKRDAYAERAEKTARLEAEAAKSKLGRQA
jgi:ribonuclease HI